MAAAEGGLHGEGEREEPHKVASLLPVAAAALPRNRELQGLALAPALSSWPEKEAGEESLDKKGGQQRSKRATWAIMDEIVQRAANE